MKRTDINIRDPYILPYNGAYYMYGTRGATTWGKADGFDCFISTDFEEWEGPIEIFKREDGFWADQNYWAPECYQHEGEFYLVTTLGAEDRKKAIYVLVSDKPEGPFEMHSDGQISPDGWTAIDGALYFDESKTPYLIFSHTFEDRKEGYMCGVKLTDDLKAMSGEPFDLFNAEEAGWPKPVPFAKKEFNIDGDVYFTDGPCLFRGDNEKLFMIWSSWITKGYGVGVAYSENGSILGPWTHVDKPLFPENGGHGMAFQTFEGEWLYALHYPNDFEKERPVFYKLVIEDDELRLLKV